MRRGNDNGFMVHDGQFIGVCLGSDFCAEHEWGIKKLTDDFHMETTLSGNNKGLKRFLIHGVPEDNIHFCKIAPDKNNKEVCAILVCDWNIQWARKKGDDLDKLVSGYGVLNIHRDGIATAWSGDDFGIRVSGAENIARLEEVYEAIKNKDACLWVGGSGTFKNGGLNIGIYSNMPEDILQTFITNDEDTLKLQKASEKTGIMKKVDKANKNKDWSNRPCGYHAISPRWIGEDMKHKSKHPVMYWLNPADQRNNAFGWYTVEELEQWIKGNGPVKEKAKEKN